MLCADDSARRMVKDAQPGTHKVFVLVTFETGLDGVQVANLAELNEHLANRWRIKEVHPMTPLPHAVNSNTAHRGAFASLVTIFKGDR